MTKKHARRRPGGRRHRRGLFGLVAVGVVLAGCASGGVAVTAGATTKPNNRVALSSVTLRMGDQFKSVQTLLQTSGELKNLPFHITWSDFPSGSSGVAALTGGSIDAIPTADAPALFAYAAHAPVKVVSASLPSKPTESIYGVMVPANSSIRKLSDLAGKSAGWETGSVGQYFALQALKKAHVRASSVTFVNLTAANALSALNSGKVDALFSSDPYLSIGQALFHDKVIASGAPYVKGETFWIASDAALAKPAVTEAMGELVARYAKAQEWASVHRAQWAATFAHITGLPASVALLYVNRSPYLTVPITSQNIIKPLQEEADFFHQQNVLSSPLNVKGLFYTKFNKRV